MRFLPYYRVLLAQALTCSGSKASLNGNIWIHFAAATEQFVGGNCGERYNGDILSGTDRSEFMTEAVV